MEKTQPALSRIDHQKTVFAAMLISSALCIGILAVRIIRTHTPTYSFLAFNLFLAWLPLLAAFVVYNFPRKSPAPLRIFQLVCMGFWLVFLPNAPYLITDMIHLAPSRDLIFWFDLTMFVAFAMTGLLCGLVSLYWMQQLISRMVGVAASWVFVLAVSAMSGFGIYLGRVLNWNSWDVISNPSGLLMDIWERVRHPVAHFEAYAFSGLFALFLVVAYVLLGVLTRLRQER